MKTSSVRLVRAIVIVGCAVLLVPYASAVIEGAGFGPSAASSAAAADGLSDGSGFGIGLDAAELLQEGDPFAMLDRIEAAVGESSPPPEPFAEEAGFPPGAQEMRANADGLVVGCTLDAEEGAALELAAGVLVAKGWRPIPLQGASGATFVKQSGRLRWMLVTCTQVGDATSVVYRLDGTSGQTGGSL